MRQVTSIFFFNNFFRILFMSRNNFSPSPFRKFVKKNPIQGKCTLISNARVVSMGVPQIMDYLNFAIIDYNCKVASVFVILTYMRMTSNWWERLTLEMFWTHFRLVGYYCYLDLDAVPKSESSQVSEHGFL